MEVGGPKTHSNAYFVSHISTLILAKASLCRDGGSCPYNFWWVEKYLYMWFNDAISYGAILFVVHCTQFFLWFESQQKGCLCLLSIKVALCCIPKIEVLVNHLNLIKLRRCFIFFFHISTFIKVSTFLTHKNTSH